MHTYCKNIRYLLHSSNCGHELWQSPRLHVDSAIISALVMSHGILRPQCVHLFWSWIHITPLIEFAVWKIKIYFLSLLFSLSSCTSYPHSVSVCILCVPLFMCKVTAHFSVFTGSNVHAFLKKKSKTQVAFIFNYSNSYIKSKNLNHKSVRSVFSKARRFFFKIPPTQLYLFFFCHGQLYNILLWWKT